MRLDLVPVLTGDKDTIEFDFAFSAHSVPEFSVFSDYDIVFTSDIAVRGTVRGGEGYTVLRCDTAGEYKSHCARCAADISGRLELSVEKCVTEELEGEDEGDYILIEGGGVDMDAVICDEFLLNVPSKLLCREDCRGLCPKCGADLNESSCSCRGDIDPRMAKLAQLLESEDN